MARTYTNTNLRCANPNCNSKSVKSVNRVICYECERCFHNSCVNLEDKNFGTFLCPECNETIRPETEQKACYITIGEGDRDDEPCTNTDCVERGVCFCPMLQEWSERDKGIDSCRMVIVLTESDLESDEEIFPVEEEPDVRTPCANRPCGMRGKHRLVCLGCGKFYHYGCINTALYGQKLFWCEDCCYPRVRKLWDPFTIVYLDISSVVSKIERVFNRRLNAVDSRQGSRHGRRDDVQRSRVPGRESIAAGQESRPPGEDLDPEDLELLNCDPFINDPDLVDYDPILASSSYHPDLGPRPSTLEEIRAWRDRVREAEREIRALEMRMQKARVIDRDFYGTFQEVLDEELLDEFYATPCDAQICSFRGLNCVMCIKCQRMFHTGCLSLPDYDYETTICFYCPLSDSEWEIEDDDNRSEDYILELHL